MTDFVRESDDRVAPLVFAYLAAVVATLATVVTLVFFAPGLPK